MSSTSLERESLELLPSDRLRPLGAFEELFSLFDQHFPTDGALAAQRASRIQQRHPQVSAYPIRRGDEILVHAGAGGVGLLLTQIAKTLGAVLRPPCLRWKRLRSHLKQALMKFFGTRKWIC